MLQKNLKKLVLFASLLFALPALGNAQQPNPAAHKNTDSILAVLPALPKESVYLQFDKNSYNIGDTVWFKGIITAGDDHQTSDLSNILYVELIDAQDSVIKRLTLYASRGLSNGDFPVLNDYVPAEYRIRAYTKYMLNYGPDFFFNKVIPFGVVAAPNMSNGRLGLSLYPEGGNLVNGIRSKVAIELIAPGNTAEAASGTVFDSDKNEVATFIIGKDGLGAFPITPVAGKTYWIAIDLNGKTLSKNLPNASAAGFILTVNSFLRDSIYVKISGKLPAAQTPTGFNVRLVARAKGGTYYSSQGKFTGLALGINIPKNILPPGVIQFVLQSAAGDVLAIRNIFNKTNDKLLLDLKNEGLNTSKTINNFTLQVKNPAGQLTNSNFAVSVVKVDDVPNTKQYSWQDLYADVNLTSAYYGEIKTPEKYFTNGAVDLLPDLDLLMLTRPDFKYKLAGVNQVYSDNSLQQPEKNLTLEGLIKGIDDKPVKGAKVSVFALAEGFKKDTLTNERGYFKFDDLDLPDSTKLLISAQKKGVRFCNVYVAAPVYPNVDALPAIDAISDSTWLADNQKVQTPDDKKQPQLPKKTRILKEVKITAKKVEKPTLLNRYGTDNSYTVKGKDLKDWGKLSVGLRIKLPFVLYNNGVFYSLRYPNPALHVVFNNVEIDPQRIDDYLDADDIENVKILEGLHYKTLYGIPINPKAMNLDDIILITTKQWAGTAKTAYALKKVTLNIADENGAMKERIFYTGMEPGNKMTYSFPGYAKQSVFNPNFSGNLNSAKTIYWNPNIDTNSNGEASISFMPPAKGNYRIEVTGIDQEGNLGSLNYRYKVE
ncbi:hypothetical protein [Mucilaginibacter glaciei]|uniref:Carboxypeptidase regulatory-like domain-containing protein n=1 Tax=Mucilaginibacter glaciei TaxID=2772109 RepID=A0A926S5W2_9SPHI|nr:hypothetical protein [Mucilaginibacter glaciei]MBD1393146.1 hypothetical protein [Mucilaginibacter glaciei]